MKSNDGNGGPGTVLLVEFIPLTISRRRGGGPDPTLTELRQQKEKQKASKLNERPGGMRGGVEADHNTGGMSPRILVKGLLDRGDTRASSAKWRFSARHAESPGALAIIFMGWAVWSWLSNASPTPTPQRMPARVVAHPPGAPDQ